MSILPGFGQRIQKLNCHFCDETNHVFSKKLKIASDQTVTITLRDQKKTYMVDRRLMYYDRKNKPMSYYDINNPTPLHLPTARSVEASPGSLRKLLDSKVVNDLFSEEGQKTIKLLMFLIIANMCVTVAVLLKVFGFIK